jgi:hypothetical protein
MFGKLDGRRQIERCVLDCKIISYKETKEIGRENVDWIYLAQVMVQWQSLVNTVLNFCVQ